MKRLSPDDEATKPPNRSFIVQHPSGGTYDSFFIDTNSATIGHFRAKLSKHSDVTPYLIVSYGKAPKGRLDSSPPICMDRRHKIFFYEYENEEESLQSHIRKFHPEMLGNHDSIFLYMLYPFPGIAESGSRPKSRIGKMLLPENDIKRLDEDESFLLLKCPLSKCLITRALKLNERFYDIYHIASYLFECMGKMQNEKDTFLCPLKYPVPRELFHTMLWYLFKHGNSLQMLTRCLLALAEEENHQTQYDSLLLSV